MTKQNLWPVVVCAFALMTANNAVAATINVPTDYATVQEAIDAAVAGDEIVLATGTYRELINMGGKSITLRSTDPLDPAVVAVTILDGDVDINGIGDGTVITCNSGEGPQTVIDGLTITGGNGVHGGGMHNFDNSSPTVTNCAFTGNTAAAGGGMNNWVNCSPTVTNCTFIDNTAGSGGGIYNRSNCSPTVTNCSVVDNTATRGGGMRNLSSSPTVTGCTFTGNTATDGGGLHNDNSSPMVAGCTFTDNTASNGGGMYNEYFSSPTATNCTFLSNTATYNGGAMRNESSSPTVASCTFTSNTATYNGGAMHNVDNSSPTVTNCVFTGNDASTGGGMHIWNYSDPTVSNCLFIGNTASSEGGGIYSGSDDSHSVTNCILWGNAPEQIVAPQATTVVSYSIVQGGWAGPSNGGVLDTDPLFMDADGFDDDPLTFEDNDYRLRTDSPAIDAGDNGVFAAVFDLGGNPRLANVEFVADTGAGSAPIIDIGAYEHPALGCLADIADANGPTPDGVIDVFDLLGVLAVWGQCADPCPPHCLGDITNATDDGLDCAVDVFDMLELLESFGNCPNPLGACCIAGSSCEMLIRTDCETAGGTFLGGDVVCDWLAGFLDTDGDELSDVQESCAGTNPNDADSDNDGIPDGLELEFGTDPLAGDINSNGIPDWQEDFDGDGLTNLEEWIAGTNVNDVDTDNDGISDHDELAQGSDPLDASDGGLPPDPSEVITVHIGISGGNEYPRGLFGMEVDGHLVLSDGSQQSPYVGSKTITLRQCESYEVRGVLLAGVWTIEVVGGSILPGHECRWVAESKYDGSIVPVMGEITIWDQSSSFALHLPDGPGGCGGAVPFNPVMSGESLCFFCIGQPDPVHEPDLVCAGETKTYSALPCSPTCLDVCDETAWQWSIPNPQSSGATILTPGAEGDSIDVHFESPGNVSLYATNGCCEDQTIPITVAGVDLDIDSDNTNGTGNPDGSPAEDLLENALGHKGKYVPVNRDNDDDPEPYFNSDTIHERIDDYGDGYDRDGIVGNEDDSNPDEDDFIPLKLKFTGATDPAVATFTINYNSSDPMQLAFDDQGDNAPPNRRWMDPGSSSSFHGYCRLWTRNGNQNRSGRDLGDPQPGHFIGSGVTYTLSTVLSGSEDTLKLYIEGIDAGSITIDVEFDPDGPTGPMPSCNDSVRLTVVDVEFTKVTAGFDHTINPRGLMVPADNINVVDVNVDGANVLLRSTNVTLAEPLPVEQPIGVNGVVVLNSDPNATGSLLIEAYMDTPDQLVINRLRAYVLKESTLEIGVVKLIDSAGHTSQITATDANAFFAVANEIWAEQANIRFAKRQPTFFYSFNLSTHDLGDVIQAYGPDTDGDGQCEPEDGEDVIVTEALWQQERAELTWVLYPEVETDCPPDDDATLDNSAEAFTEGNLGYIFGDDEMSGGFDNDDRGEVYAHEAGHHLSYLTLIFDPPASANPQFDHTFPQGGVPAAQRWDWELTGNLMGPFADHSKHITLRQAVIVNEARQVP